MLGPEVETALTSASILVQPLGAIEQHGPHLPLVTDLAVAEAVAEAAVPLAVERGVDAWLLPPIAYTKSNEHAWSPGTIWMSARTMLSVLEDLGRCVAATPVRKLVFLNGHGGNSALVAMANRELRLQFGLETFLAHPSMPADRGGGSAPAELGMGIHGGAEETSLMLHLRPDLVDMSKAVRAVPEHLNHNKMVRFGGSIQFGWLSNDFGDHGHIGDPTTASAVEGARLFSGAVDSFVSALIEIATFRHRV
ncbi:MAG: creatininase family protein [Actinobacteria bacterium]|nr:creatininase family protein [Actinomycetota bacterium]